MRQKASVAKQSCKKCFPFLFIHFLQRRNPKTAISAHTDGTHRSNTELNIYLFVTDNIYSFNYFILIYAFGFSVSELTYFILKNHTVVSIDAFIFTH